MKKIILASLIFISCIASGTATTFVTQILEPTGGKLLKPDNWHYLEKHRASNSLYWIVSKEDPVQGYETGLAIQFMIGIKEGTGLSPEDFAKSQIKQKISSASVIELCEQDEVGGFSRICLKVSETQNRDGKPVLFTVLYSFFWSNSLNSVGITIAGSPSIYWDKYSDTFNTMNKIEIIDPARFK